MKPFVRTDEHDAFVYGMLDSAIKISLLALMLIWCFQIIKPFIHIVLWGGIIAVALFPLYRLFEKHLGGRSKLSATFVSLLLLTILIAPMVIISDSIVSGAGSLADSYREGTLKIPPPSDKVAGWPIIGQQVHDFWTLLAENLEDAAEQFEPQIKAVGTWLLSTGANAGLTILQFIVSILIGAVFLVTADKIKHFFLIFFRRLADEEKGGKLVNLSIATIRSVAQGVIGIAIIQALLSAIGLFAVGMPAAGLWTFAVLMLAIVQLPPLLVLGPIIVYVFSYADTTVASIFAVYALIVSMSDSFLKPLLLGRGVDVPMLIILMGAIGGMILSGIIGLFTGAVVLALGYKLFTAWMNEYAPGSEGDSDDSESGPDSDPDPEPLKTNEADIEPAQ